MEQEIINRLQAQEELLQKVYVSSEKTRKYFLWTIIGSLVLFLIPLLILTFVLPKFVSTITSSYGL